MSLQMQFNPPTVRPNEQPAITVACTQAWKTYPLLKSSNQATVYRGSWWHENANDPIEHVTVRYNRVVGGRRVHIYRNGTGNMTPHRPRRSLATTRGEDDAYDSVPELSEEEWNEEKGEV